MCSVSCNEGFHFEPETPLFYVCLDGKWLFYDMNPAAGSTMPWPDCIRK